MSTQANKTVIGIFVVGAVALAVAAVVVFGSGKFFTQKVMHVALYAVLAFLWAWTLEAMESLYRD